MVFTIPHNTPNVKMGITLLRICKVPKWRNWLSKFEVYHWGNSQLDQKSSKLHHLSFKFLISNFHSTFTTHERLWLCKNPKMAKKHPTGIFDHASVWGLAQKCLILIDWITMITLTYAPSTLICLSTCVVSKTLFFAYFADYSCSFNYIYGCMCRFELNK